MIEAYALEAQSTTLSRHKRILRGSVALSALVMALSFAGEANAADSVWQGGAGNWTDAAKWTAGTPPSGNKAVVGGGPAGQVTIDSAVDTNALQVGGGSDVHIVTGGVLTTNPTVNASNNIGFAGLGDATKATMTIDQGGIWEADDSGVRVGNGAEGELTVKGTMHMTGGTFSVGGANNPGGKGTLNIDGGTVTNDVAALRAGYNGGTGTVNITNAGKVTTSNLNTIGDAKIGDLAGVPVYGIAGGTGVVNISSAGSSWTITPGSPGAEGNLILGRGPDSEGTLNITDGGKFVFQNNTAIEIGSAGGTGVVTVKGSGSVFDSFGGLSLGKGTGSTGTMTITDGATANARHLNVIVGHEGGTGTLNIANGGTLNSENSVYVGNPAGSTGTLNITNGGKLNVTAGSLEVGAQGTGTGLIDGTGTVVTTRDGFGVGHLGTGTATVSNGAVVKSTTGNALIGWAGGTGTLNVTSGGQFLFKDSVTIGWGDSGNGTGTATVTGAGSRMEADKIQLGYDGDGAGSNVATGTLTVADGASIKANEIIVGFEANGTGTLNIGAGGAAGTVDGVVRMGGASSTINFNHNAANYVFSESIKDGATAPLAGSVNFIGTGTTTLTEVNTYTSATNVNKGELRIAAGASIADSVLTTVNDGAALSGAGKVGNVSVKDGATVAPTGMQTLTAKDVTFEKGSTYAVSIDSTGKSSKIAATKATLNGGDVKVAAAGGGYRPGMRFTVITTTGGVTGKFDAVQSDTAFLDATLGIDYTGNNVDLALSRNSAAFDSVAKTANQKSVARHVDALGVGNEIYGEILGQTETGARTAFDALSGEAHASNQAALVNAALLVSDAIGNHLSEAMPRGQNIWAKGFGSWADWGSDGNAAKIETTTGGVVSGIDATTSGWRVGVAAGYSETDADVNARKSSLETESFHLSAYGGTRQGPFGVLFGAIYSWSDISSERSVEFPGFSEGVHANYDAGTTQVFGEANYRVVTNMATFEPFVGLSFINHNTDAFSETGGDAALRLAKTDLDVTFTTVGLRPSIMLGQSQGYTVTGRGTVAWRHAFGDTDTNILASLAGDSPFSVAGSPIAEDSLLLEAGVDLTVSPDASVGLSWTGQYADEATDNQLKGEFVYRW